MAEGSCLQSYHSPEVVEIRNGMIGVLLEGSLKEEGKEGSISAPAGVLSQYYSSEAGNVDRASSFLESMWKPSCHELHASSFNVLAGAGHRVACFQVQAPARVLVFNHTVLFTEYATQSPFRCRKALAPRLLSLEQLGWGERPEFNGDDAGKTVDRRMLTRHSSKYVARALELGFLESKVHTSKFVGKEAGCWK